MATPNFSSTNTSKIFAFGCNKYYTQDTIDANEFPQDWLGTFDELQTSEDYKWELEGARCSFQAKGWDECDESNGNRSYPGIYFAEKMAAVIVAGCRCEVTVKAAAVSGYYEGNTFDWDAFLTVYDRDGYEVSEYDLTGRYAASTEDVVSDNWTGNKGLSKIHARRIMAAVSSLLSELTTEAESVFEEHSERRLACAGIFSNGEAIYTDLDTERGRLLAAVV